MISVLTGIVLMIAVGTMIQHADGVPAFDWSDEPDYVLRDDAVWAPPNALLRIDVLKNDDGIGRTERRGLEIVSRPDCGRVFQQEGLLQYLGDDTCRGLQFLRYRVDDAEDAMVAEVVIEVGNSRGTAEDLLAAASDRKPPVGKPFKMLREEQTDQRAPEAPAVASNPALTVEAESAAVDRADDGPVKVAETADAAERPLTEGVARPTSEAPKVSGAEMTAILAALAQGAVPPASAAVPDGAEDAVIPAPTTLPTENAGETPGPSAVPAAENPAAIVAVAPVTGLNVPQPVPRRIDALAGLGPDNALVQRAEPVGDAPVAVAPESGSLPGTPATERPTVRSDQMAALQLPSEQEAIPALEVDRSDFRRPDAPKAADATLMTAIVETRPGISASPTIPQDNLSSGGVRIVTPDPVGSFSLDDTGDAVIRRGDEPVQGERIARADPTAGTTTGRTTATRALGSALRTSPVDADDKPIDPVSELSHIAPDRPTSTLPYQSSPFANSDTEAGVSRIAALDPVRAPRSALQADRLVDGPVVPLVDRVGAGRDAAELPARDPALIQIYLNPKPPSRDRLARIDPALPVEQDVIERDALRSLPFDQDDRDLAAVEPRAPAPEADPVPVTPAPEVTNVTPRPRPDAPSVEAEDGEQIALAPADTPIEVDPVERVFLQAKPDPTCTTPANTTIEVLRAARSTLSVEAPCHRGTIAELQYSGIRLAVPLDDTGFGRITVLGFEPNAAARLRLAGRDIVEFDMPFKGIARVSRVALVWDQSVQIQLNAFEFDAPVDSSGHVWAGNARSFRDVRRDGGGFMTSFKAVNGIGQNAEIYSHWLRRGGRSGVVKLAIDYVSRNRAKLAGTCGDGALAAPRYVVIRSEDGRLDRPLQGRLAAVDCSDVAEEVGDKRLISGAVRDLLVRQR